MAFAACWRKEVVQMTATAPGATQNAQERDLADGHAPAVSERLIRALEAHRAAGVHDIADYQDLAQHNARPVVKLLLGLIVEDEQQHNELLQQMLSRLQQEVDVTPSAGATLPGPSDSELAGDDDDIARLRALIRDEEEGAPYLRHIARQEAGLHDGLFRVLLETIARDSQKHAFVLRFLLRSLEGR
jgi:rubrerythrin